VRVRVRVRLRVRVRVRVRVSAISRNAAAHRRLEIDEVAIEAVVLAQGCPGRG